MVKSQIEQGVPSAGDVWWGVGIMQKIYWIKRQTILKVLLLDLFCTLVNTATWNSFDIPKALESDV